MKYNIEFRNPYHIVPPGAIKQILSHPRKSQETVELAIFQEHRYAFFYWVQWARQQKTHQPPSLVSLDWHQDLCYPCSTEKKWLSELNKSSDGEVAIFSWAKLAGNNDGHILSAAYLNLIENIYVHCRQGNRQRDWEDETIEDLYGNIHLIKKFQLFEDLEKHLFATNINQVYFDIDLDFFTLNNPYNRCGEVFSYMSKKEVKTMLAPDSSFMQWIFDRMAGFTIATEPNHCGGLLKSNYFLNIINQTLFAPDLFSQNCDWRHKI